jgi:hypothetical protein
MVLVEITLRQKVVIFFPEPRTSEKFKRWNEIAGHFIPIAGGLKSGFDPFHR